MEIIDQYRKWSTSNEMEYVKGIMAGKSWGGDNRTPLLEPKDMIRNYLRSAKNRKAWDTFDGVDADKVIKFAEDWLRDAT